MLGIRLRYQEAPEKFIGLTLEQSAELHRALSA